MAEVEKESTLISCPDCNGTGRCPTCHAELDRKGQCVKCYYSGRCLRCGGSGRVAISRRF